MKNKWILISKKKASRDHQGEGTRDFHIGNRPKEKLQPQAALNTPQKTLSTLSIHEKEK